MKRLIIVCEGQTEQSFCQTVLFPYFLTKDIVVEAPTIKHSHGGIVPWETLKRQLVEHLHEGDAIVTMLIDFYRIKDSYQFPGWEEAKTIENSLDKMNSLFLALYHIFSCTSSKHSCSQIFQRFGITSCQLNVILMPFSQLLMSLIHLKISTTNQRRPRHQD